MTQFDKENRTTDLDILEAFVSIKRGQSKHKESTLHKPLLLLFMLGKYWNNSARLLLFQDMRFPFEQLLKDFCGPKIHDEAVMYPFWYLQSSHQIWTVVGEKTINKWFGAKNRSDKRPSIADAMNCALFGGFTPHVYRRIINDKVMLLEIVFTVLREFFPIAKHIPLLQSIGIPSKSKPSVFQQQIFANYHYSCSICEFPGIRNDASMDLQVAYIRPPVAGGPKTNQRNCITMCDKHKNLFDFGAFTISKESEILISEPFRTRGGSQNLLSYDNKRAIFPDDPNTRPDERYLAWHRTKAFQTAS
ncbi:MAG: hypothetical protein A6F71_10505 [Cycloclasticus sp. symbiont of Poecilosclerida sp. M]|nr:MAG: hypothetical protein A6F71_10505 [Cycloclasticus sp. symbiont of Poecilosclerida sp. M]